jgi:molybdenum cofactor cytidylyltransferase
MPWVNSQTTRQLVDALHADVALAAPFYREQRGHPVAFSTIFYNRLSKLDGDVGARHIVQQHAHELMAIEVDDEGVVKDVDYPGMI